MIKGSNPGREWMQGIIWMGAEDELKCWSYDYYVVLSGMQAIGTELTKREAWELYKAEQAKGTAKLSIERWMGGGNSEASDSDSHACWPPEAVKAEFDKEEAEQDAVYARVQAQEAMQ
jgi:hypothetical protein